MRKFELPQTSGFIRAKELSQALGVSRSTLWRMEKSEILPKKISITGSRAVGWRTDEIIKFVNSRKQIN